MLNFPRALIFAHFDPDGLVDSHVIYALQSYREYFARIIFVTTASLKDPNCVRGLVDVVIQRPNVGLDFYSWKVGLGALGSPNDFFEVIFCNDSIYGPFFDLEQALVAPVVKDADMWGMSLSWQFRPHIQSYFFSMRYPVFAQGKGQLFWDQVNGLPDKTSIIQTYEIEMAHWFKEQGFNIAAVFNPETMNPLNPSLHNWKQLLISGVPYVKVELLRSNPQSIDTSDVYEYLKKISKYPANMIGNHIERTSN